MSIEHSGHDDSETNPVENHERLEKELESACTLPNFVQPGAIVGNYRIVSVISHGGCGTVFLARQLTINREIALKIPSITTWFSENGLERFFREADAMAKLKHDGIVPLIDFGEMNGLVYLAMPFYETGTLAKYLLSRGSPLSEKQAASIVMEVARAVHYAHEHGIAHRDLKPSNLLLEARTTDRNVPSALFEYRVLLADFGLAKTLPDFREMDLPSLTEQGTFPGTTEYMAPEQFEDFTADCGSQGDIYSLGVILYELITGRPPFQGSNKLETIAMVREQDPIPLRSFLPRLSKDLETICLQCLRKRPQQRYATAADLASDLRNYLNDEPIKARPTPVWEIWLRKCRKNPIAVSALALTIVITLVSTIFVVASWRDSERQKILAQKKEQEAQQHLAQSRSLLKDTLLDGIRQASAIFPASSPNAVELMQRAQTQAELWLEKNPDDPELRELLISVYHWQGKIARQRGHWENAIDKFQKSIELVQNDASLAMPEGTRFKLLSQSFQEWGDCYVGLEGTALRHDYVIKAYEQAMELYRNRRSKLNLLFASNLGLQAGSSFHFIDEDAKAHAIFHAVWKMLAKDTSPNTDDIGWELSYIHASYLLGFAKNRLGMPKEAREIWRGAFERGIALLEKADSLSIDATPLAKICHELTKEAGDVYFKTGTAILENRLRTYDSLLISDPDRASFLERNHILLALCQQYKALGENEKYQSTLKTARETETTYLTILKYRKNQMVKTLHALLNLVTIYQDLNELATAGQYLDAFKEACHSSQNSDNTPTMETLFLYSKCLYHLDQFAGKKFQGLTQRTIEDLKRFANRSSWNNNDTEFLHALPILVRTLRRIDEHKEAHEIALYSIDWLDKLGELGLPKIYRVTLQFDLMDEIGKLHASKDEHLQAIAAWEKAVHFSSDALNEFPTHYWLRQKITRRSFRLGQSYVEEKDFAKALLWYENCARVAKHQQKEYQMLPEELRRVIELPNQKGQTNSARWNELRQRYQDLLKSVILTISAAESLD